MSEAVKKDDEFRALSSVHLSRLLELGLAGPREPLDRLILRLRAPDGLAWLEGAIASERLGPAVDVRSLARSEDCVLATVRLVKERGNAFLASPQDKDAFLCGMAGYFFAIAAGLVHHGELLTQQAPQKLEPLLCKLAAVVPEPWTALLNRAAELLRARIHGGDDAGAPTERSRGPR